MGKVSYSQLSMWTQCPHRWKLNYIDDLGTFTDNIYTLFGTSVHETIQAYLVCYYGKTIKEADSLPMYDILQYRMETNYKDAVEKSEEELDITLGDMKSFYKDGCDIIDEFIKHKSSHFPKKNTELVGIEISLNEGLDKNIEFRGFGRVTTKIQKSRIGRNPKTGEDVTISERRVVTFKSGLKLKNKLEAYDGKPD